LPGGGNQRMFAAKSFCGHDNPFESRSRRGCDRRLWQHYSQNQAYSKAV